MHLTAATFEQQKRAPLRLVSPLSAVCPLLFAIVIVCAGGCFGDETGAENEADNAEATAEKGVNEEYARGPLTVRILLNRKDITIAETVNLTVEAEIDEDYEVTLPTFGEKLRQFGIIDYQQSEPRLIDDGRILVRKTCELEPFLSGEYEIPAMEISFVQSGTEDVHTLTTAPFRITVRSLLPADKAALEIADIAPPQPLPHRTPGWLWALPVVLMAVLLAAAAIVVAITRRRRRTEAVYSEPAHERAYRELQTLVDEDLIGNGRIKLFYLRISAILRRYIENRFGLQAPERTTEEFLAELSTADVFTEEDRQLLQAFLQHCDLVKFAEHKPETQEIQKTFDTCRTFIEKTREPETEAVAA